MNDNYEIRLFDRTLIEFKLIRDPAFGNSVEIMEMFEPWSLYPPGMKPDADGVLRWLEKRVIPKNRTFVDEILRSMNLARSDTKGIVDVCKGLSLGDSYWVVPSGFKGTFAEYNLYENRFSEILSLVAYTGVTQSDAAFSTSPELTTDGMLPKAWRYIEGSGIYLYKGGTSGAANTGKEPYSEYYASQVAKIMSLNAVHYDLENWKGILASKCKLFTDINTAYVPIGRIVKTGGLAAVAKYYENLGSGFFDCLCDMLVFDALIYNEDRHFGNFGLLFNSHTGKIISTAPIFDNGASLFNYAMPKDYDHLEIYAKTRTPVYDGTTFEGICRSFISTRQVEKLRKMLNFTFERHPKLNLPDKHLRAIEKLLRARASELIGLTSVKKRNCFSSKNALSQKEKNMGKLSRCYIRGAKLSSRSTEGND